MTVRIGSLRVGRRDDSDAAYDPAPTLSWTTVAERPGWLQASAELELDGTERYLVQGRDSVHVSWPFSAVRPRERHRLRVRVTGEDGSVSEWSESVMFWAGFLAEEEWAASMIGGAGATAGSSLLLRHEFPVRDGVARATLYATARGVYDVFINGDDVDAEVLKPGWTPYSDRLIHESTDVTARLRRGLNAIGVMVADGWYAERIFGEPGSHLHGDRLAAAVQILIEYADGTTETVVSDGSWRVSDAGPLRSSSLYDGERYDARRRMLGWTYPGFDDSSWGAAPLLEPGPVPSVRTAPAVRRFESVSAQARVVSASGEEILDFGQNLVGRLHIRVSGEAGTVVRIAHAEVLENGELGRRPLRSAEAVDEYILRGDEVEEWEPRFTFHGFRYAQLTSSRPLRAPAEAEAVVIHSDLRRTGWFRSSHELLDRLHENVVWGMRGNFLALPTDCPQRDERLGWTGDIQVFAPTASYLYDVDAFLASWLEDLALEQTALGDGSVPFVVPNVLWDALTPAAAWGDAATVVPSVLLERYGDIETLRRQFSSMRDWVDRQLEIAGDRMLWEGGFQFGDWLDPSAPPGDPFLARTDHDIVATAYLYRSLRLVASAAELLKDAAAAHYAERADAVKRAFISEYVSERGRVMSDTETAYALAVQFGLHRSADERQRMGDRLAELVRGDDFRIATGFVGTPLVTDALTITGHDTVAERLLLQTRNPSWLYPVTMGATTIWERWDSMLEDGTINPGEMTSFNHYALGAVADWMHRSIGGIAPAEPGYRRIRVAPRPLSELSFAVAEFDSPYGLIRVEWKREPGVIRYLVQVPPNTTADVCLRGMDAVVVGSGHHAWTVRDERDDTAHARIHMQMSTAQIADDPSALERITAMIESTSAEYARRFRERTRWASDLTLERALLAYPPDVRDAVSAALDPIRP